MSDLALGWLKGEEVNYFFHSQAYKVISRLWNSQFLGFSWIITDNIQSSFFKDLVWPSKFPYSSLLLLIIIIQSKNPWTCTETDAEMQLSSMIPSKRTPNLDPINEAHSIYLNVLKNVIHSFTYTHNAYLKHI
jgi:hypothetical protein